MCPSIPLTHLPVTPRPPSFLTLTKVLVQPKHSLVSWNAGNGHPTTVPANLGRANPPPRHFAIEQRIATLPPKLRVLPNNTSNLLGIQDPPKGSVLVPHCVTLQPLPRNFTYEQKCGLWPKRSPTEWLPGSLLQPPLLKPVGRQVTRQWPGQLQAPLPLTGNLRLAQKSLITRKAGVAEPARAHGTRPARSIDE